MTVVCKATFELRPGQSPLAAEQIPPLEADLSSQGDPRRSLLAASDLVPFKRNADVLVTGHAYAPGERPTTSLIARIAVGSIDKSIEVHRDRAWTADGRLVSGELFVRMPLVWERAAWGTNNPVGHAPHTPADARGLRPIPNLMPPGFVLRGPTDTIPAVGTGPIAPTWHSRAALLGRHASTWDYRAWNTRPLPDDLDGGFFNAAPIDQQLAKLSGDETIELENLLSWRERLVTRLARVGVRATVQRGGTVQDVPLRCDTLCIDTDRGTATLVWRGVVMLANAAEHGLVAVVTETKKADGALDLEGTAPIIGAREASALASASLSFAQARATVQNSTSAAADPNQLALPVDDGTSTVATGFGIAAFEASKPALPFVTGMAAPSAIALGSERPPTQTFGDGTETMLISADLVAAALPFTSGAIEVAAGPIAEVSPAPKAPPPPPVWVAEPAPAHAEEEPPRRPGVERGPLDVAPPPMIGPIAEADRAPSPAETIGRTPEAAAPPAEARLPEPRIEPQSKPVELTIEQTATIAAEIAEGQMERVKVFEAHGVSEGAFRANEAGWNRAIEDEQGQGKNALRAAYDAAYVARVEKFRGLITIEAYARIMVGLKRGRANAALDELRIQRPALMPIVRLWTKKVAKDVKLGDEVTKAVREATRA